MSTHKSHRDDQKLLFAVAGVVVAGAVGIALLAGLASAPDDAETPRGSAVKADTSRVEPAFRPSGSTEPRVVPAVSRGEIDTEPTVIVDLGDLEDERTEAPEEAFEIRPGEDLVAGGLAAYHARSWDRAAAYFQARVDERTEEGWSHYMLGLSLWKAGRNDEASEALGRAAELAPSDVRARVNLARVENERGEYEAALDAANSALAVAPGDPSASFLVGRSLYNLGRNEEALVALEQSRDADPNNGYVHNLFGLIAIGRNEAEVAAGSLARAAELEPDVAFIHNNLGMALELGGMPAEALLAYRRAVEIDSGHGRATANLARLEPIVGPMPLPVDDDAPVAVASVEAEVR